MKKSLEGFLNKVKKLLDRIKYFGLRKVYYVVFKNSRIFLEDFWSPKLVSQYLSRKIIDNYNGDSGHNINKQKTFLGFGLIHYILIRNFKPKRVLCIGSRKGFIPALCALACKDNNVGMVDFVDASYDKNHSKSWSGIGFWKKIDVQAYFKFQNLNNWINVNIMKSKEFTIKYPQRRYGYIYIDGDHSYKGVKSDYQLFWPKLDEGGLMVFHDVIVKNYGKLKNFGVWKFWKEIRTKHKIIFPFPPESGLGIIQKFQHFEK